MSCEPLESEIVMRNINIGITEKTTVFMGRSISGNYASQRQIRAPVLLLSAALFLLNFFQAGLDLLFKPLLGGVVVLFSQQAFR